MRGPLVMAGSPASVHCNNVGINQLSAFLSLLRFCLRQAHKGAGSAKESEETKTKNTRSTNP